MKFSTIKKYRKKHRYIGALLLRNPVLVIGLDLPFVIAAGTSLRNAAAMSLEMFVIHMSTMLFALTTVHWLHKRRWLQIAANAAFSTLVMVAFRLILIGLFKGILNSLGIYIYLMAINGMTQLQASELPEGAKPGPTLAGAFMNALGFSLTVLAVSAVREYFGNGTLWGFPMPITFKLSGLLLPFAGFIIMAFLLAFVKFLNKQLLAYSMAEMARREARYTQIRRRARP